MKTVFSGLFSIKWGKCSSRDSYLSSKLGSSCGACRREPRHLIWFRGSTIINKLLQTRNNFIQREAYGFRLLAWLTCACQSRMHNFLHTLILCHNTCQMRNLIDEILLAKILSNPFVFIGFKKFWVLSRQGDWRLLPGLVNKEPDAYSLMQAIVSYWQWSFTFF